MALELNKSLSRLIGFSWVLPATLLILFAGGCASDATRPAAPSQRPAIAVDADGAATRLGEAIRIKTISADLEEPNGTAPFRQFADFLTEKYSDFGGALTRETVNEFSFLYTWKGEDSSAKPLLLIAHLDVVPIDEKTRDDWHHPPFSGLVADGMIWGRGSLDDKLSVLGILEGVDILVKQGFRPNRTIYIAFGHDEELSGAKGAQTIAEMLRSRGVHPEYVLDEGLVITDGIVPGVKPPVALIGTAEKGYLSLRLTAMGTGGHSSMPPPETAIGRLARAIVRLQKRPMPAEIRPPTSQMLAALAPEMSFPQDIAVTNLWLFEGMVVSEFESSPTTNAAIRTTAAATKIAGGIKDNVLPQSANVIVNFRILPGDDIDDIVGHVRKVIDDPEITIDVEGEANEASPVSSIDADSYRAIELTTLEVFPDVLVAPGLVIAATDSRHYVAIADNVYRFLPVKLDNERLSGIHGVNERLGVAAYGDVIRFYVRLIENTAGQ
ncbi:MAG: M20 family peptidase [Alphaproteobacteria bacterium]|nr:M20 family peptidase [Alphaproteobacteria bacterium]